MDRDSRLYALVHYVLMIGLIFLIVGVIDATVYPIDLLVGVVIAVVVGFVYPAIVRRMDVAPAHWER